MLNQAVKIGLKAKKIKLPQMNYFLKKQIKFSWTYSFHSAPFILQNFKNVPQFPFFLNKNVLVQNIITFIYLLALFLVQNFKKFLQRIQSHEDAPFWGPKWSICPKQNFFLENY